MFSYRHAFHAGNHADVLKHLILIYTLDYFKQKDTPFWVIDTHAGPGLYNLMADWSQHSKEYLSGLDKLLNKEKLPDLVQNYLNNIKEFNANNKFEYYPGSPAISYKSLRSKDKLFIFELLEAELNALNNLFYKQMGATTKQVHIKMQDGFIGLPKILPPTPRRAIVLIDPSYENKADYKNTLGAIKQSLKKFPQGTYLIWHPLVQRTQLNEMLRALKKLNCNWLHTSLYVRKPAANGLGMHGSGMFIINPPWQLHSELKTCMPWLSKNLAQDNYAKFTLEQFEPK